MSVTEFKRGVPTYKDKDDNEFGLLCETKEVCVTDNDGVSLEYKIQNLLSEISRLSYELQSCASEADLANYLPKSGGAVSGDVTQEVTQNGAAVSKYIKNVVREIREYVGGTGNYKIYDNTNGKDIVVSTADGTNTFNGTASGNLPLTGGGTVSADRLFPIALKNTGNNVSYTRYEGKDGILGFLGFSATNAPTVLNNSGGTLGTLLHTGNSAKVVVSQTAPSDTSALWVW